MISPCMAVWREGVQEEISKQSTSTAAVGVVIVLFYFRSNIAMNHALQGYQVRFFSGGGASLAGEKRNNRWKGELGK